MPEPKARMFIAEDSRIARLYEQMFSDQFAVVSATTGPEAKGLVDKEAPFDISIIDVVMPTETPGKDYETTGLRLIEHFLATGKCRRFIVLTARHELNNSIRAVVGERGVYTYLLKAETDDDVLLAAARKLMTE